MPPDDWRVTACDGQARSGISRFGQPTLAARQAAEAQHQQQPGHLGGDKRVIIPYMTVVDK